MHPLGKAAGYVAPWEDLIKAKYKYQGNATRCLSSGADVAALLPLCLAIIVICENDTVQHRMQKPLTHKDMRWQDPFQWPLSVSPGRQIPSSLQAPFVYHSTKGPILSPQGTDMVLRWPCANRCTQLSRTNGVLTRKFFPPKTDPL